MRIYINTEYLLEHSFKIDDGIPFRQKLYQKMILITPTQEILSRVERCQV